MPQKEGFPGGTEDAEVQASRLVERLMIKVKIIEVGEWLHGGEPLRPEEISIYFGDIDSHVDVFGSQLRYCRESKLPFPCLSGIGQEDEPLPIDFSVFRGSIKMMEDNAKELFRSDAPMIKEYTGSEAKGFFSRRLVSFLTKRFKSQRLSGVASPGLQFKVVTQRQGLRVHYSPSYFFSPQNVFGAPTTPVYGWIHPGRYIFGVVGVGVQLQFDPAHFDIPPCTEALLTV